MTPSAVINVSTLIDRNRLSRLQVIAVLLCGLIAILDGLDTQAIAFVAPVVARDWGLDVSAFGPVFGSGLLGLMLGALIFGPIADHVGRKRVLIGATLWFGVFAALTAHAGSMTELLAYRFVTGIGLGAALPNVIALTSEYAPTRSRATLGHGHVLRLSAGRRAGRSRQRQADRGVRLAGRVLYGRHPAAGPGAGAGALARPNRSASWSSAATLRRVSPRSAAASTAVPMTPASASSSTTRSSRACRSSISSASSAPGARRRSGWCSSATCC